MKIIITKIIFILIIFINYSNAQENITVEYLNENNTDFPVNLKTILNCNTNNSVFTTFFGKRKKTKTSNEEDNSAIISAETIDTYQVIDLKEKTLFSIENIDESIYKINEELPHLLWQTESNETKRIERFSCNKAKVTFRGRNWIAWYSTEIPYSFGPWKFNGLPGLILEIYDDTNRYHWTANKVKFNIKGDILLDLKDNKFITNVSLKEFVEKQEKLVLEREKRIYSMLPRGSEKVNEKSVRKGIEVNYEWE